MSNRIGIRGGLKLPLKKAEWFTPFAKMPVFGILIPCPYGQEILTTRIKSSGKQENIQNCVSAALDGVLYLTSFLIRKVL
jgi:hypothetical protein